MRPWRSLALDGLTSQSELSNEWLASDSVLWAAGACRVCPAPASGVYVVVPSCSLELTGVVTSGALADCVSVRALSVPEVPGVTAACANSGFLAAPALRLRAERLMTRMSRMSIWGAPLRASGIEAPADAIDWLDDSVSPVDDLGRSARPIAKQPTNAATQRPIAISEVRGPRVMRLPATSGTGALRQTCS